METKDWSSFTTDTDSVNHINISPKGATELGRMLAHFYYAPFTHPYFGPFYSMEGFWYYVRAEEKDDRLRTLSGLRAKRYGSTLKSKQVPFFKELIVDANFFKIEQNEAIKRLMIESNLPFDSYYLFGSGHVQIRPKYHDWLIEGFEKIRQMLQNNQRPEPLDYNVISGSVSSAQ